MNEQEFLGLMQSDNKLWALSVPTVGLEGSETRCINVPWGIGVVEVTFEGTDDAAGRRAAFSAFGDYIRGLVKDRIDDDAITARAEQVTPKPSDEDGRWADDGGSSGQGEEAADKETVETPAKVDLSPEGLANYLTELKDARDLINNRISESLELKEANNTLIATVESVLEGLNASTHKKTPTENPQATSLSKTAKKQES